MKFHQSNPVNPLEDFFFFWYHEYTTTTTTTAAFIAPPEKKEALEECNNYNQIKSLLI
jgi:hypothetical protein